MTLWTVLAGLCEGQGWALGREGGAAVFPVKSLPPRCPRHPGGFRGAGRAEAGAAGSDTRAQPFLMQNYLHIIIIIY